MSNDIAKLQATMGLSTAAGSVKQRNSGSSLFEEMAEACLASDYEDCG